MSISCCSSSELASVESVLLARSTGYPFYHARRAAYDTGTTIPFRVSPDPLRLTPAQASELAAIGQDVTHFFQAVDELYRADERVRALLDRGKPEVFRVDPSSHYIFLRPDLIITETGFALCEIETSPFGLALADLLNRAYREVGHDTLVGVDDLADHIRQRTPASGTIIYSSNTRSFEGQMAFLADKVFSGRGRKWWTQEIGARRDDANNAIYRGFYLAEYADDPAVRDLIHRSMSGSNCRILPSPTPHLEEKAILAFLWDTRWEAFLTRQLGSASFRHLRQIVPPTWIVGEEKYFSPGLPGGVSSSVDLVNLSKAKRTMVLKVSGFCSTGSWSEGVTFLHKKSREGAMACLQQAADDPCSLHIVQEFKKGMTILMQYYGEQGAAAAMMARVRITPYYSFPKGRLIAIKATGCEGTDYIHATSGSVNTAVGVIS